MVFTLFLSYACSTDDVELIDGSASDDMVRIPDAAFGEYLFYNQTTGVYQVREDGESVFYLNPNEVTAVTSINVSKTANSTQTLVNAGLATAEVKITDLTGIEYFTGLSRLVFTSNSVASLDVSKLSELEALEMNFNLIGSLDLTGNTKLTTLRFRASASGSDAQKLSVLDLSTNTALTHLFLPDHNFVSIDLSANAEIREMLDMSGNPGPDGDRSTGDIVVPDAIYTQLTSQTRLGVVSDAGQPPVTTQALIINEVLYDPSNAGLDGDANGDGVYSQAEDEFVEFYNDSDQPIDMSGYKVYDATGLANNTPRHIFPANTILPGRQALVLFGGGTPIGDFCGAIVQTSTTGDLNLNNEADLITITDANDEIILTFDIAPLHNNPNESYTRSPDITGGFVRHSTLNSLLFSPGTKLDGTPF